MTAQQEYTVFFVMTDFAVRQFNRSVEEIKKLLPNGFGAYQINRHISPSSFNVPNSVPPESDLRFYLFEGVLPAENQNKRYVILTGNKTPLLENRIQQAAARHSAIKPVWHLMDELVDQEYAKHHIGTSMQALLARLENNTLFQPTNLMLDPCLIENISKSIEESIMRPKTTHVISLLGKTPLSQVFHDSEVFQALLGELQKRGGTVISPVLTDAGLSPQQVTQLTNLLLDRIHPETNFVVFRDSVLPGTSAAQQVIGDLFNQYKIYATYHDLSDVPEISSFPLHVETCYAKVQAHVCDILLNAISPPSGLQAQVKALNAEVGAAAVAVGQNNTLHDMVAGLRRDVNSIQAQIGHTSAVVTDQRSRNSSLVGGQRFGDLVPPRPTCIIIHLHPSTEIASQNLYEVRKEYVTDHNQEFGYDLCFVFHPHTNVLGPRYLSGRMGNQEVQHYHIGFTEQAVLGKGEMADFDVAEIDGRMVDLSNIGVRNIRLAVHDLKHIVQLVVKEFEQRYR